MLLIYQQTISRIEKAPLQKTYNAKLIVGVKRLSCEYRDY